MNPASNDDRIALVIDTQARLDGIKSARAEVRGLGAETQALGVTSVGATRNMDAFSALQAEAAGHVGSHSLALGRLERNLAGVTERTLGLNSSLGLLGATSLKFGLGDVYTVAIVGGLALIASVFDKLTEAANESMKSADKAIDSLLKAARIRELGIGGQAKAEAEDVERGNAAYEKRLGIFSALAAGLRGTGLDVFFGGIAEGYAKRLNDSVTASKEAVAQVGEAVAKENEKAARQAEAVFQKELSRLAQLGTHISGGVLDTLAAVDKSRTNQDEAEKRGLALHAEMQAKTLELTLQSLGKETEAKLAANQAEFERRLVDIRDLDDTEAQKTTLYLDAEQQRQAGAAAIRKAAADKEDRERHTAEDKVRAAEKRKAAIILSNVDTVVRASGSLQRVLIQAALSPLIKELEGTAVRQFVRAAASWAAGDWPGAARHAAAGALATAGAREVAQLGEMSGGGGSLGGSVGGGSSSSGTFEPRLGNENGGGMVTFQLYSQNPYGAEQIQQLQFSLNRAGILKVPVPISPTNQLKAVA